MDQAAATFGRLLRPWRAQRHGSQLALASNAEVSARHLSWLQTGKAQASTQRLVNRPMPRQQPMALSPIMLPTAEGTRLMSLMQVLTRRCVASRRALPMRPADDLVGHSGRAHPATGWNAGWHDFCVSLAT